jgi:hypothetical protein
MKNLIWINDYNLSFDYKNSEKIFIFSPEYLELISVQRLRIIYQELCRKKIRIFKGEYFQTIKHIVVEENFSKIIIPSCPDAKILKNVIDLKKSYDVGVIKTDAVMFDYVNSKRFFEFWNLIKNNITSKN